MTDPRFTPANLVALAHTVLGVPYKFGGQSPKEGFDCSGLWFWLAAQLGAGIARTSEVQFATFTPVAPKDVRAGDAVFFDVAADDQAQPAHVGIVLSFGVMLDAPHTGEDVSIQPFPFAGGTVRGYGRPPYASPAPPAPAPAPQKKVVPVFIARDNSPAGQPTAGECFLIRETSEDYIPDESDLNNLVAIGVPEAQLSPAFIAALRTH